MVRLPHLVVIALALACAACNTDSTQIPSVAAVPGQASLTITRSSDLMYMGAPAAVDLNGARIADLSVGQSYSGNVPPGMAVLAVSAWSAPGSSSLRFNLEPGKSYRFVVTPRGAQMAAGMAGGIVGQAVEGGGPFQIAAAQ